MSNHGPWCLCPDCVFKQPQPKRGACGHIGCDAVCNLGSLPIDNPLLRMEYEARQKELAKPGVTNGWVVNPQNERQWYCLLELGGPTSMGNVHPEHVMRILGSAFRFKVLAAIPQSVADVWQFWIEFDPHVYILHSIPHGDMFRPVSRWMPVGEMR